MAPMTRSQLRVEQLQSIQPKAKFKASDKSNIKKQQQRTQMRNVKPRQRVVRKINKLYYNAADGLKSRYTIGEKTLRIYNNELYTATITDILDAKYALDEVHDDGIMETNPDWEANGIADLVQQTHYSGSGNVMAEFPRHNTTKCLYFVHYRKWPYTWDQWAKEVHLLPINDQTLELQRKLKMAAKEAKLSGKLKNCSRSPSAEQRVRPHKVSEAKAILPNESESRQTFELQSKLKMVTKEGKANGNCSRSPSVEKRGRGRPRKRRKVRQAKAILPSENSEDNNRQTLEQQSKLKMVTKEGKHKGNRKNYCSGSPSAEKRGRGRPRKVSQAKAILPSENCEDNNRQTLELQGSPKMSSKERRVNGNLKNCLGSPSAEKRGRGRPRKLSQAKAILPSENCEDNNRQTLELQGSPKMCAKERMGNGNQKNCLGSPSAEKRGKGRPRKVSQAKAILPSENYENNIPVPETDPMELVDEVKDALSTEEVIVKASEPPGPPRPRNLQIQIVGAMGEIIQPLQFPMEVIKEEPMPMSPSKCSSEMMWDEDMLFNDELIKEEEETTSQEYSMDVANWENGSLNLKMEPSSADIPTPGVVKIIRNGYSSLDYICRDYNYKSSSPSPTPNNDHHLDDYLQMTNNLQNLLCSSETIHAHEFYESTVSESDVQEERDVDNKTEDENYEECGRPYDPKKDYPTVKSISDELIEYLKKDPKLRAVGPALTSSLVLLLEKHIRISCSDRQQEAMRIALNRKRAESYSLILPYTSFANFIYLLERKSASANDPTASDLAKHIGRMFETFGELMSIIKRFLAAKHFEYDNLLPSKTDYLL